jgi:hypothetical protein
VPAGSSAWARRIEPTCALVQANGGDRRRPLGVHRDQIREPGNVEHFEHRRLNRAQRERALGGQGLLEKRHHGSQTGARYEIDAGQVKDEPREGNTLVIDVTNFSPKTDFQGSRENLHLIERWTRTGPRSLEYAVTIEDPTVWTRPWTVKQEFTKQSDEENRLYYEPRCVEGNYALPGWLQGHRLEERAFAEGRGPNPATKDDTAALVETEVIVDPLQ